MYQEINELSIVVLNIYDHYENMKQ